MRMTNPFHELLSQQGIMPMEAMSWTKQNAKSIQIALPKETSTYENRIGLTPQAVQLLIANGHEVILERGAGERAGFSDADYLLAGASVTEDLQQVWQGGLILKINAPTLEEVGRMMPGQSFVSCASKNQLSGELLDEINRKQLIAIGLEYAEDNAGGYFDVAWGNPDGARAALAENRTYDFFAALNGLVMTGPTRTNVNDIRMIAVEGPSS